ncbi:MAG: transposase [Candidatus Methanoculleus thermohydrogenotrophicum]
MRKDAREQERRSISYHESKRQIPIWKKEHPELSTVYSQVLQDVSKRVDLAFEAFFRRVKAGENPGYPRSGFHLNDAGTHLSASKIGDIPIVLHRPIEGPIKTLTIRRTATGKWYACSSVEYEPTPAREKGTVVGVDVGLESFATLSNGEKTENPRFFRTDEKALAKAQRKLSITEKETPERKKARKVVARIHERIANRRLDFAHQTSRMMVDRFGTIVFENLKITNMQKKHCRCGLESVHHDHREQSGRGWFSCDPGESQKYITAVFPMWYDRR